MIFAWSKILVRVYQRYDITRVNREQYQKKKSEILKQNDIVQRRTWCLTCRRKEETCLCHALVPFKSDTIISLLMHPKEAKKQRLGTGYLTHAILKNSRIFSDVNLDENQEFQRFLEEPDKVHLLLYPAEDAWSIDTPFDNDFQGTEGKTIVLHLLDATWPCAKKMMRLSSTLQRMKKVSFSKNYESRFLIKHQPHEACLSTIETVYHCLEGLKAKGLEPTLSKKHQNLLDTLDELVAFQLKCELDPNIPSTRGHKPKGGERLEKGQLKKARIRPKKNRLFYWDVERSPVGHSDKKQDN